MEHTISLIVPVYKVESYIHRCIDSILSQTFDDFELILVDDGSPDNCPLICDEYAKKDNRVIVIHKENGGLSSARNAGLDYIFANSNSQYISFIDSDDWVDERYLELLYDAIINNGADVAVCGIIRVDGDIASSFDKYDNRTILGNAVFCEENSWHYYQTLPSKLYVSNTFKNKRFANGVVHEDEFFANNYYRKRIKIAEIENQLYYYQKNPTSITINKNIFTYICAIRACIQRITLFRLGIFVHNRKDMVRYVNQIIGYILAIRVNKELYFYKKAYFMIIIRCFFLLPFTKASLKYRMSFLSYMFYLIRVIFIRPVSNDEPK